MNWSLGLAGIEYYNEGTIVTDSVRIGRRPRRFGFFLLHSLITHTQRGHEEGGHGTYQHFDRAGGIERYPRSLDNKQ